jgi:ribosomal protein S27AE
MLKLMRLIAAVLIGISVASLVFNEVKVSVAQTAKSDKIKCPRCGFMNPAKNPDGTPNIDCDKCGHSIVSFAADKGPSKIDPKVLATYAPKAKAIYSLFRNKCSKCHTLARPLNTDLPPTKWEEYIKRMMNKPGSGIKPSEAKEIWQFLVYDTAKRRTKFFNTLPEKEKQIAQKVVATLEGNASSN